MGARQQSAIESLDNKAAEERLFALLDADELVRRAMRGRPARALESVRDAVQSAMAKVLQEVRRAERGTLHDVFCRVRSGKQTRMDGDLLMSEAGRIVWSVLGTELRSETRRGRYTQAAGRARPLADWGTPSRLVRRAETRKECATLIDSAPPPVKALIVDRYFEAKPQGCKSIAKAHEKSPASLDKSCQRTVRDFARKNPNLQLDSRSNGGGRHP